MADSKAKQWTDSEKLSVLFQVIEKAVTIPWDELTLPEGRDKKSVRNMLDKEKAKLKKAREAEGGGETTTEATPSKGGKRGKKVNEGDDDESPKKKAKTPKKGSKKTAKAGAENTADAAGEGNAVKVEAEGDEIA